MSGPPPKAPGERRRRNKDPLARSLGPAARPVGVPKLVGSRELLVWTREYWVLLWSSPMAAVWTEADVPALLRLARLQDRSMRDLSSVGELAEIRQLEDRFGLSPLARRRLQWDVDRAQAPADAGDGLPSDDDRWLRVVSG